ncbi:transcriptional regulator [Paenibacillus sp. PK3_47]|uniref:helix-turn-helix transcriptional regulator n=1 Tax=Paenibacillus sp. PK3_47 TaxID=2072642 RepID=UPI00201E59D4|nr:WYL domain-containing protein [Paenibacillus sp. PK3_47]UQZ35171.1 transcriptional regulator [Paenibacillus sp. PK3_47]
MSHTHRIQWFDQQVRAGRYPNSSRLAEQFEISKRQAQRDIEYMASSLRAPLQYVARQRGYCYEDDSFTLPYLYLTDQEKRILQYLAYRYSHYNYENAPEVRRIGNLLNRITDQEEPAEEARLPIFAVNAQVLQYFELLQYAVKHRFIVKITYDGREGELEICPLKLENHYEDDHVIARVTGRNHPEYFRLSSILDLQLTTQHFADDDRRAQRQGTERRLKPFHAQLRLGISPETTHWYGFPVRHTTGDIYEAEFYDQEQFVRHLLTAEWLELLGPAWLKQKITDKCSALLHLLNPEAEPL